MTTVSKLIITHFLNQKGESMKRKIALLLAIVMLLSMIPANLFAAPGTIGPSLNRSTYNTTDNYGSVTFTARIPMNLLHDFQFERTTLHQGLRGHLLFVELVGENCGPNDLWLPQNSQWAAPWDEPTVGTPATATQDWALGVFDGNVTGVMARPGEDYFQPERGFNAMFHRQTDRHGAISLGFDLGIGDGAALAGVAAPVVSQNIATAAADIVTAQDAWSRHIPTQNHFDSLVNRVDWAIWNIEQAAGVTAASAPSAVPAALLQELVNSLNALATSSAALVAPALMPAAAHTTNAALFTALDTALANYRTALAFNNANINAASALFTASGVLLADVQGAATVAELRTAVNAVLTATNAHRLAANNAREVALHAVTATEAQVATASIPNATVIGGLQLNYAAALAAAESNRIALNPILRTFNPADGSMYVPRSAGGFLHIDIPVQRVRCSDARMIIRLADGTIVAEGYLLNAVDNCVTVITGDVIKFENTVTLDRITIRENFAGALTDLMATTSQSNPRTNSLAIRILAPAGYVWERTEGTTPATHSQRWYGSNVRRLYRENGFPVIPATGLPLYTAPNFPASPFITSPHNILRWHCTVDGVYMVGNRQELLIIFDNLVRYPNRLAHLPAELHIDNLRLAALPTAAPATAELNIDVFVGVVCAWGYTGYNEPWAFPNPEFQGVCDWATPPPSAPGNAPDQGDDPRGPGLRPQPTTRPGGAPPEADVTVGDCFYFSNPSRFPTSREQVTRTSATDGGLALQWNYVPTRGGAICNSNNTNQHVATRVNAGFEIELTGDAVRARSGHVNNVLDEEVRNTARSQNMRITELVPGAFALSSGRPITFTAPEGVQIVGVTYNFQAPNIGAPGWSDVFSVTRNISAAPVHTTQFAADRSSVTIAHNTQHSNQARRLNIQFDLSVEAGFAAANNTDVIELEISGAGIALLRDEQSTQAVAEVWDPITVTGIEPIQFNPADFQGREQNIVHTSIGDQIVIAETEPGALALGTELWVYVAQRYGIGWPLSISRGTTITGEGGLALTVSEQRNTTIITPAGIGNITNAVLLTVTNASSGEAGSIVLDGTTLFGHVYQGEVYYFVVTGNAVAANHVVVAGNHPGTFSSLPYGAVVVEEVPAVGDVDTGNRANSLSGFFCSTVMANGTPEVIFERLPGMAQEGGFIQAREFAYAAGVDSANVHWNGATGEAIISGWDYQGNWLTVIMHRNSPSVTIIRGGDAAITGDIATIAPGTADPGTLAPVFRYNRIYLPARFLFTVFGYSADYNFERVGTRIVITPM